MQGLDDDDPTPRQQIPRGAQQRHEIFLEQRVVEGDDIKFGGKLVPAGDQIGIAQRQIAAGGVGLESSANQIGRRIDPCRLASGQQAQPAAEPAFAAADILCVLRSARYNCIYNRCVGAGFAAGN
jgi:hypothetical protein